MKKPTPGSVDNMPIPYGIIFKLALGIIAVILVVGALRSCGTLYNNFWTERDNRIKEEIVAKENAAYQKARAEEMTTTLALTKEYYDEIRSVEKRANKENQAIRTELQEKLNKDVVSRVEELESDVVEFNRRAERATRRKLDEKEKLSDLSTATAQ